MKKLFAATAMLLLFTSTNFAQKFDRETLTYQNTHLPSKLIYDQVKTYGVNVIVNNSNLFTMDYNYANSLAIAFTSYDKVEFANANLQATVVYGPCAFIDEKTSSVTRDEEVNKVKTKVTYYKRILNFRYYISYKLVNAKNNSTLYNNEFASSNVRSVETPEFKSEAEAGNYMNTNRNAWVAGNINELSKSFMAGCNNAIRDMYDFYPSQSYLEIFQIRKWDKDDEYNAHIKSIQTVFKSQTADEQPAIVKEKLKNDITYLQGFEDKFNPKDKKEDMLFFCNYYNLATVFFCLDEYAKAKYYVQKLDSSDKNEVATRNLKNYIASAEKRTARHFVPNTHLTYNPVKDFRLEGKAYTSDAASASENIAASFASGNTVATDKATMADNTELTGKIVLAKEKNEIHLVTKDNPGKPVVLTPINCLKFNIDTLNYIMAKNSSNGTPVKQFFQVHYASDKIKLIQFVNTQLVPEANTLAFIRPSEEVITWGVGMGIKKKLAKYFEDCPAVSEKAKDGDFGGALSNNALSNLKKACVEYDACK